MVYITCLYMWDHRCDNDFIENILAVYDTLEKAVEYSKTYNLGRYQYIEIVEMELEVKLGSYDKDGKKIL
jgi:molecular chaperone GrpE (heat shock protein)